MTRQAAKSVVMAAMTLIIAVGLAGKSSSAAEERELLLALSWQPGFCETMPEKTECREGLDRAARLQGFSVHGLWPQPKSAIFCGIKDDEKQKAGRSRDWGDLPPLELAADTRAALERIMPGHRLALHRYQWIKHGSCYGTSAEVYFADMVRLVDQINASALGDLFRERIGGKVTREEMRQAALSSFGPDTTGRFQMTCRTVEGRKLLLELRISLKMVPGLKPAGTLPLAGAQTLDPGCRDVVVDAPGPG